MTRLKKFGKKGRFIAIFVQIVAIWYISILSLSYFTSDTGAYFSDKANSKGTFTAASDFCEGLNGSSDYWHKHCKDNAGIGNGPDAPDEDTGEKTDPDNPGHNKDDCDDHTNAPCTKPSEVTNIVETVTSNSIGLSWSNANLSGNQSVKIYRDGNEIGNNIKNGQFLDENLLPATKYTYKLTTVDKKGNESQGIIIEITTSEEIVVEEEEAEDVAEEEVEDEVEEPVDESVSTNEVTNLEGSRSGKSSNINLSWTNVEENFSHINIYIEGQETPILEEFTGDGVKNLDIKTKEAVTLIIKTVTKIDDSFMESEGVKIEIK